MEQSDVVLESKIIVDKDSNVDDVMDMMEGFIGEDGADDNLKITYMSNKTGSVPAEGDAAIQALQDDFELDDEEEEELDEGEDEELLEMVSHKPYSFIII